MFFISSFSLRSLILVLLDLGLVVCFLFQRPPTLLAPGTGFVEDSFSTGGMAVGGDGSGHNASRGERWGAADEASLARPLMTSCCAARFLTRRGPVQVQSPGVGDPCSISRCVLLVRLGIHQWKKLFPLSNFSSSLPSYMQ